MDKKQIVKTLFTIAIFIIVIVVGSKVLSPGIDWRGAFRPAALALLRGESPYDTEGFMYPPWTALLLLPIAVFPVEIGQALLIFVYLFAVAFTAYKFGGNKISILFILASPPVLHGLLNGNIDGLVILGFVLPPWLGLFLLVIKPQISFGAILYIFIIKWKTEKILGVVRTFAPVTVAYILSIIIFGPWPLRFSQTIAFSWNASMWPLSIPIGLAFLVMAIRSNNFKYSILASPLLSPYVLLHSWVGTLLAISPYPHETIVAVVGIWLIILIRIWA